MWMLPDSAAFPQPRGGQAYLEAQVKLADAERVELVTGETVTAVWIDVLMLGEIWQWGEPHEVTEQDFAEIEANYAIFRELGYILGVSRQHIDDGYVYGEVHGTRRDGERLQMLTAFADPADREAYNAGKIRHFSPGVDWATEHPHTGEQLGTSIFHLAFVSEPAQKNLRYPQQTSPGVALSARRHPMTTPQTTIDTLRQTLGKVPRRPARVSLAQPDPEPDPLETVLAGIVEVLAEIHAKVFEVEAAVDPEPEPDVEGADAEHVIDVPAEVVTQPLAAAAQHSDADGEVESLRALVLAQRSELIGLQLDAAGVTDDTERAALTRFGLADGEGLRALLSTRPAPDGGPVRQPAVGSPADPGGTRFGIAQVYSDLVKRFAADDEPTGPKGRLRIQSALVAERPTQAHTVLQWSRLGAEVDRLRRRGDQPHKLAQLEAERTELAQQFDDLEAAS